jgi:acetoacetyl-CoA synthetase
MGDFTPARQDHLAVASLIKIWEGVFERSPIFPNDNFFKLGGDSLLAADLCCAIEEAMGQTLSVATVRDAPTIAALAAEMERISPRFRSLVMLKGGNLEPPLFMAAGAGGNILRFAQLAKNLSFAHPVYAIEARGPSVEETAKSFLRTLRARQPNGPYMLVGQSSGGLVALEVAQNLVSLGEEVPLLALLDTYPHPKYWRLTSWIRAMIRMSAGRLLNISRMPVGEMLPDLWKRGRNLIDHVKARCKGAELLTIRSEYARTLPEQMRVAFDEDILAWNRYPPRYYPGKITFLKAHTASGLWPGDPVAVWDGLAQTIEVHTIPGDHFTMLTKHSSALGAELSLCFEKSLASAAAFECRPPSLVRFNATGGKPAHGAESGSIGA